MKNKFKWIGIALITAVLIFGFTGCPEESSSSPSGAADLKAVLFGEKADTSDKADETYVVAGGMTKEEFEAAKNFGSGTDAALAGKVTVTNAAALTKNITLTVSGGAKVKYFVSGGSQKLDFDKDGQNNKTSWTSSTIGGSGNSYLYVRVTAENGKNVKYYVNRIYAAGANTTLGFVTVTTANGAVNAEGFIGGETVDLATMGILPLTMTDNSGVLTAGNKNVTLGTVNYAIAKSGEGKPSSYNAIPTTSITFADGDKLYFEVKSQNGSATAYYVVEVQIGRDARLESLNSTYTYKASFSWQSDPTVNVDAKLKEGKSTAAAAEAGMFEPGAPQPDAGFPFTAVTKSSDAKVKIAKGTLASPPSYYTVEIGSETEGAVGKASKGDHLFIEVTSGNGQVKLYYVVEIILAQETVILYGQPKIRDAGNPKYIDPLWDNAKIELLNVSRVNLAEMTPTFGFMNPADEDATGHTMASAKTMWDDEGLYVYVEVDFYDFYNSAEDKASETETVRTASSGIDASDGDAHTYDSVEIFANERIQTYLAGNYGNQYRITPPPIGYTGTEYPNGRVSGAGSVGAEAAGVDILKENGQYNSWIKTNSAGKQTGYVVVAQIPWRSVSDKENANQVFDANGMVNTNSKTDGPWIGYEIQLNTAAVPAARDAILTWNGINGQSYQNVANYGKGQLVLSDEPRIAPVAAPPTITAATPADMGYTLAQLQNDAYTQSLSVTATTNAGALSYQWYSNTDGAEGSVNAAGTVTGGTLVSGATAATFKPPKTITTEGDYYYFVLVTNTRGSGSNATKAYAVSRTATVTVTVAEMPVFKYSPRSRVYKVAETSVKLTADTNPIEDVTVTYEWWKSTVSATDTGGAISGQTGKELPASEIATAAVGKTWYWVVAANGTVKKASNKAEIEVVAEDVDFVLDVFGTGPNGGEINTTVPAGYQPYFPAGHFDFGASFDITKYNRYKVEYTAYNATMGVITGNRALRHKWRAASGLCHGGEGSNEWGFDTGVPNPNTVTAIPAWLFLIGQQLTAANTGIGNGLGTPGLCQALQKLDFEVSGQNATTQYLEITRITFFLEPQFTPPAPYELTVANGALIFQSTTDTVTYPNGYIDWAEAPVGAYGGVSVKLDLTNLPAPIEQYTRITIEVKAYDDVAGTKEIFGAGNWTATFFEPWVGDSVDEGYGSDDFPSYSNTNDGKTGRMMKIGSVAATSVVTANSILEVIPEGFRVEREKTWSADGLAPDLCPVNALKIVSIKFWHRSNP